jgi:hypothetical protein
MFTRAIGKEQFDIVSGIKISTYFAVKQENHGWLITHLPSGYLLTRCPWGSKSDAKTFIYLVETILGDQLNSPSPYFLKVLIDTDPRIKKLWEFIQHWLNRKNDKYRYVASDKDIIKLYKELEKL